MKRWMVLAMMAATLVVRADEDNLPKVAVANFQNEDRHSNLHSLLPDLLEHRLVESEKVAVIERRNLQGVLGELEYSQSGLVREQDLMKFSSQHGVRYLIVGKISYTGRDVKEVRNPSNGRMLGSIVTQSLLVNLKIQNTETARLEGSVEEILEERFDVAREDRQDARKRETDLARRLADTLARKILAKKALSAPQVAKAPKVKLFIDSVPAGADVLVNGVFVGNAGEEIEVTSGRQRIEVRLAGHDTWSNDVECEAGKKFTARLHPRREADLKVELGGSPASR